MKKQKGKCILIGAGDLTVSEISVREEDLCIAIDGGIDYCSFLNVVPDLVIGDFDSVTEEGLKILRQIEKETPERIIRLMPEKDDTDMLYGLKKAMDMGYREFRIYAGMGGRFDHALANVQCLLWLKNHDAVGYLMDGDGMVMVLKNESVNFKDNLEGRLSLFSLGQRAEGVTISGMKYELNGACVTNDYPIGISNEFIGKEAGITVENGEVVLILRFLD